MEWPTDEECREAYEGVIREEGDKVVLNLDKLNDFYQACYLLNYAMTLRAYGACAPGGNETWRAWDASVEKFLRRIWRESK